MIENPKQNLRILYVPLSGSDKVTLISAEDANRVLAYSWCLDGRYVKSSRPINGKRVRLHRFILDADSKSNVDHINGNGLDNTRENLRLCTQAENLANQRPQVRSKSSKYKGVFFHSHSGLWVAALKKGGKRFATKYFKSEVDAAVAYNSMAKDAFGDFARFNEVER